MNPGLAAFTSVEMSTFLNVIFGTLPPLLLSFGPSIAVEPLSDLFAVIEIFEPILTPSDTPSLTPALPSAELVPIPPAEFSCRDESTLASPPPLITYRRCSTRLVEPPTATLPSPASVPRPSTRIPVPNIHLHDYVASITCITDAIACVKSMGKPRSYTEAIRDPTWHAAMHGKMTSITANHTWDLVPLPPNIEPIAVKWIYKLKTDADGRRLLHKARLVARDDTQLEGIDFVEIFSLVGRW